MCATLGGLEQGPGVTQQRVRLHEDVVVTQNDGGLGCDAAYRKKCTVFR